MKLIKESLYEIKKSKFSSYYYEVDSIDEVNEVLKIISKEHKKARHIPYAYIIDGNVKKTDDKEPSNTAGLPIYTILEKKKLNHALIVVVRYFGGIKLGAGGLFRAYMTSANQLLDGDNI